MSENLGPVSDVYKPQDATHHIQDEPATDHYANWGYTIGYEFDTADLPVPQGGNTAVFRIASKGLTEPVFVTKSEPEATFTVKVLDGIGTFIRAGADGTVDQVRLEKGSQVVVHPGEAYSYANAADADLILHDVALPAFKAGDDVDLTSSLVPEERPMPKDGYSSCVVATAGSIRVIELPSAFYDALSAVM